MRRKSKVIALLLCSALIVSGSGTGIGAEKTQAASRFSNEIVGVKTASGDAVDVTTPPALTEQPQNPSETDDAEQTQVPSQTADAVDTEMPEVTEPATDTATEVPVQTTIPPLESPSTTVTPPAVTPAAVYAVGDKLTVGNYVYAVEKAPTSTASGTVKLKSLTTAARTKKTLNVPATISKDGYTFSVTGIGQKAFTTSTAVETVRIRKNVTFIGVRAFQQVKTLKSVTIGENVTTIKQRAFAGCSALRTVTIPSKVKLIGARSFYNCKALKSVLIESKKITTIKTYAFKYNKSGRYFVMPSGKKSLYQSLLKSSGATVKVYTY